MDFIGQAHWFLIMHIAQGSDFSITSDQSQYALLIGEKYLNHGQSFQTQSMNRVLPDTFVSTKEDCIPTEDDAKKLEDEVQLEYASAVGALLYFTYTRVDILFVVTKLAKYMKMPGQSHFQALTGFRVSQFFFKIVSAIDDLSQKTLLPKPYHDRGENCSKYSPCTL